MQTVKSGNRALNQQCPLHKIHKEQGRAKARQAWQIKNWNLNEQFISFINEFFLVQVPKISLGIIIQGFFFSQFSEYSDKIINS